MRWNGSDNVLVGFWTCCLERNNVRFVVEVSTRCWIEQHIVVEASRRRRIDRKGSPEACGGAGTTERLVWRRSGIAGSTEIVAWRRADSDLEASNRRQIDRNCRLEASREFQLYKHRGLEASSRCWIDKNIGGEAFRRRQIDPNSCMETSRRRWIDKNSGLEAFRRRRIDNNSGLEASRRRWIDKKSDLEASRRRWIDKNSGF